MWTCYQCLHIRHKNRKIQQNKISKTIVSLKCHTASPRHTMTSQNYLVHQSADRKNLNSLTNCLTFINSLRKGTEQQRKNIRGELHCVVLPNLNFRNQEIRQPELWNLAQWEIVLLAPGKVLWQKDFEPSVPRHDRFDSQNLCEITEGPPPLHKKEDSLNRLCWVCILLHTCSVRWPCTWSDKCEICLLKFFCCLNETHMAMQGTHPNTQSAKAVPVKHPTSVSSVGG